MMMLRFAFQALAATSLLALAAPALADPLIDNVDGVTIDGEGKVLRFTGLIFDEDGKVVQVLGRGDARPQVDYRLDGEGRVMVLLNILSKPVQLTIAPNAIQKQA
jgi:hypothetical protein